MATRQSSSSVINSISNDIPELIGGSADLAVPTIQKLIKLKLLHLKILMEIIFIMELENMQWQVMNGLALYGALYLLGNFLIFRLP